mmetsp:Transcript_918/g.3649  ORF Transcript_918/g.3649 Transcript_918/m.3649 type:complete len:216 (-) Transcript_918:1074-1721(-)
MKLQRRRKSSRPRDARSSERRRPRRMLLPLWTRCGSRSLRRRCAPHTPRPQTSSGRGTLACSGVSTRSSVKRHPFEEATPRAFWRRCRSRGPISAIRWNLCSHASAASLSARPSHIRGDSRYRKSLRRRCPCGSPSSPSSARTPRPGSSSSKCSSGSARTVMSSTSSSSLQTRSTRPSRGQRAPTLTAWSTCRSPAARTWRATRSSTFAPTSSCI